MKRLKKSFQNKKESKMNFKSRKKNHQKSLKTLKTKTLPNRI